jgi:hypothetical protein
MKKYKVTYNARCVNDDKIVSAYSVLGAISAFYVSFGYQEVESIELQK